MIPKRDIEMPYISFNEFLKQENMSVSSTEEVESSILFERWGYLKQSIDKKVLENFYFYEREIWFCSVGKNIGSEQNGQHELFERPVLIFKKFSDDVFLGFPLTSRKKNGKYYFPLNIKGEGSSVILSQIRLFDSKRLDRKVRVITEEEYILIKKAFINIL